MLAVVGLRISVDVPVFVRLTEPGGRTAFYFDEVVRTSNGTARAHYDLALNEAPGEWRVRARDAATGLQAETSFVVKGR